MFIFINPEFTVIGKERRKMDRQQEKHRYCCICLSPSASVLPSPGEHQDLPGCSLFIRHCPLINRSLRALRGIPPSTTLPPPSVVMKNKSNYPKSDKWSVQGMHLNAMEGKQKRAVNIRKHARQKNLWLQHLHFQKSLLQWKTYALLHTEANAWNKNLRKTVLWFP